MVNLVWEVARKAGYGGIFRPTPKPTLTDDHISLQARGIRAIDVVDFDYPYWHTPDDTPDKVSAQSLQVSGPWRWRWWPTASTSPSLRRSGSLVRGDGQWGGLIPRPFCRGMDAAERRAVLMLLSLGAGGTGGPLGGRAPRASPPVRWRSSPVERRGLPDGPPGQRSGHRAPLAPGESIDPDRASLQELLRLPRVGPALATHHPG